jgi:AmpD protein
VRRDGTVVRLVPDARRAWHAGVSRWRGRDDVNSFSLGWEIANRNDRRELYTDAQYAALARLAAHYVAQGLALDAFVSHAEVALPAGRKTDPAGFDWERFRAAVRKRTGTPGR